MLRLGSDGRDWTKWPVGDAASDYVYGAQATTGATGAAMVALGGARGSGPAFTALNLTNEFGTIEPMIAFADVESVGAIRDAVLGGSRGERVARLR